MKKISLLLLVIALGLLPYNAKAVYQVDENGAPIETESKEGEFHILVDDGQGTDGNASSEAPDSKENLDTPVSNTDDKITIEPDTTDDIVKAYDLNKTTAENGVDANNDNNKVILYSIGSGVMGMVIGASIVYFVMKKH